MRIWLALLMASTLACSETAGPPGPASTPSPLAAPTPLAAVTPSTSPRLPVVSQLVSAFPQQFSLVGMGFGPERAIWLVDLTAARAATELVRWRVADAGPWQLDDDGFSASRDGRVIALAAPGPGGRSAIYVVRTGSREVWLAYADAQRHALVPRLTPDGLRFAFLLVPTAQSGPSRVDDGIWVPQVDGSDPLRLVERDSGQRTTVPLAWSDDGSWFAFRREFVGATVYVVAAKGGEPRKAGEGRWVDWRGWEPRLLISGQSETSRRYEISSYSVARDERHVLYGPVDSFVARAQWHPRLERFLYLESAGLPQSGGAVAAWIRQTDGSNPMRLEGPALMGDVWWSRDGSSVFAVVGGDDSVAPIVDLLGRARGSSVCRRGGTPPDRCL